jgi:hypothetical protein
VLLLEPAAVLAESTCVFRKRVVYTRIRSMPHRPYLWPFSFMFPPRQRVLPPPYNSTDT